MNDAYLSSSVHSKSVHSKSVHSSAVHSSPARQSSVCRGQGRQNQGRQNQGRQRSIRWSSTAIVGGLLAWLGCNAMLGLDDPTCIGPCDDSALESSADSDTANDPALAAAEEGEASRAGRSNAAEGEAEPELGL